MPKAKFIRQNLQRVGATFYLLISDDRHLELKLPTFPLYKFYYPVNYQLILFPYSGNDMTLPLISAHWTFILWGIMFAIVAFSIKMEDTRIGASISGVMIAIATAILLSNLNVIPKSAPAYDIVWTYLLPLAIPLLLLKADLRRIIPETRDMLIAFLFGTLGTVIGALVGVWLLPLGDSSAKLAGIFSATYIGGSMNMAAVADVVKIDPTVLSASVAADNVMGAIYLGLLAIMPAFTLLRRFLPSAIIDAVEQNKDSEHHQTLLSDERPVFDLLHICFSFSLSLIICGVGYAIASSLGIKNYAILFITAIAVLVANLFPGQLKKLQGDFEIGMLLMYLFFVVVGASADIAQMISGAQVIILFTIIIIFFHMSIILLGGKLFKIDLAEIIIASNACAMGPGPAAAMAAGKKWKELITPAIMLGVFGYVVANFIGVSLVNILS